MRIAVIDRDRCKPRKCNLECIRFCPKVRSGVEAIKIDEERKHVEIVEEACVGCGICVRKCPFNAITVVNLAEELKEDCVHQYGPNSFRLYRLPVPKPGKTTGLIGPNGVGKTTAIKILAGVLKPNLGRYWDPPDWDEVIRFYRGSELQAYFQRLSQGRLRVVYKPEYIDAIPKLVKGTVKDILTNKDERGVLEEAVERLELKNLLERRLSELSGGELQRVAIAVACEREADVYIFDEPTNYLDIYQRIKIARVVRELSEKHGKTVLVIEHDLAVLDYLSDYVCVIYGEPGVYGVVSSPHGVKEGINIYLDGYIPDLNIKFRREPVRFSMPVEERVRVEKEVLVEIPPMKKSYNGSFTLEVEGGEVYRGEVIVAMGPNGIGKTTLAKLLAGVLKPDEGSSPKENIKVAYKPQYIRPSFEGTVEELLLTVNEGFFKTELCKTELIRPLGLEKLLDKEVPSLSGGELQRVAIVTCLLREADLYIIDEGSAFLDVEQRLAMARAIRRFIRDMEKSALVIEHDIIVANAVADRVMLFTGESGVYGKALKPMELKEGMNLFLSRMDVTFRRDLRTGRPRINKPGSRLDRIQKEKGEYYYVTPAA